MRLTGSRTAPFVRPSSAGFSLIEVLVAVLILSIGLLGLAGLQAASVRNTNSSYLRSQAVTLAGDITDRMRANLSDASAGSYNVAMGGTGGGGLPQRDLKQWQKAIDRALPDADGSVAVDGSGIATIRIEWNDPLKDGKNDVSSFQFQTQLPGT